MNDGWFVVSMCLSSMNDWKIYENGGLSAGCELKLFGRGGDSFFHGGCCVWCVVASVEVVDSKKGRIQQTREQIFLSNSYVPCVKSIIIISMYIMKQ